MITKTINWGKKKALDLFKKSENGSDIGLSKDQNQTFEIKLGDKVIAYLEASEGKWKFYYDSDYKSNESKITIPGFSNFDKIYESDALWSFFKIRIPGLGQPQIIKTIKKEHIPADDEVALLKRFGRKSISNPYRMEPI